MRYNTSISSKAKQFEDLKAAGQTRCALKTSQDNCYNPLNILKLDNWTEM